LAPWGGQRDSGEKVCYEASAAQHIFFIAKWCFNVIQSHGADDDDDWA